MKSLSILGAYACSACHDVVDRRTFVDRNGRRLEEGEAEIAFWHGHARTLRKLVENGLVTCAGE